jgi:hypothetical protein
MKQFKVASLGEGNKTAYDSRGARYFVPTRFRSSIKKDDYALWDTKHFDQSTELDADGNPVMEDGKPKLIDKPFDRDEITMVGDLKTVVIAKNEDTILNGVSDSIVKEEVKRMKTEFKLDDALAAIS